MDRVMIVSDEVIYATHLERTLLEVGFEVLTYSQEFALIEAIEKFAPDIIIVKGDTQKISTLRTGQILKEGMKFSGKVILIVNKNQKFDPTDINRVRMDYLLFEPIGAIKVVSHVLNLMRENRDAIRNRLIKMATQDKSFRLQEENFIGGGGKNLEQEIIVVSGQTPPLTNTEADEIKSSIMTELNQSAAKLQAKIESYNAVIGNLDIDLSKGLKTRHTAEEQKKLQEEHLIDPGQEKLDTLDSDRQKFVNALFADPKLKKK